MDLSIVFMDLSKTFPMDQKKLPDCQFTSSVLMRYEGPEAGVDQWDVQQPAGAIEPGDKWLTHHDHHGWIMDESWMNRGWIVDEPWMNHWWTIDESLMNHGWIMIIEWSLNDHHCYFLSSLIVWHDLFLDQFISIPSWTAGTFSYIWANYNNSLTWSKAIRDDSSY